MRPDEVALLKELARVQVPYYDGGKRDGKDAFATDVGRRLGVHPKRAAYLFDKWLCKGWWDFGVSPRTGWLTAKGLAEVEKLP
jgi:hypothetical protein